MNFKHSIFSITSLPPMASTTLLLSIAIACLSNAGCRKAEPPQTHETTPATVAQHRVRVALLGDPTRIELLSQLANVSAATAKDDGKTIKVAAAVNNGRVTIMTAQCDQVAAHAPICSTADLAVIAVDARNGPMPIHREHILFARQMHVPGIMIVLTHCDAIDDPELLELEDLEMRELLTTYGWNGAKAIVSFDPEQSRVEHFPGIKKGASAIASLFPKAVTRPKTPAAVVSAGCAIEVYALSEQEAFPVKTTGISSGEYALVLGKTITHAQVHTTVTIAPGASGSVAITLAPPLGIYIGQRCAILTADHVVAVGVIKSTQP